MAQPFHRGGKLVGIVLADEAVLDDPAEVREVEREGGTEAVAHLPERATIDVPGLLESALRDTDHPAAFGSGELGQVL